VLLLVVVTRRNDHNDWSFYLLEEPAVAVTTAVSLIAFAGRPNIITTAVLGNPVSRWLGRISYSMYLWVVPVALMLAYHGPHSSPQVAFALGVIADIALAAASYHLVERPFLRMKERLAYRTASAAPV
jgi:peptidoglycan/LPS O-acetylase OafA/YrhL